MQPVGLLLPLVRRDLSLSCAVMRCSGPFDAFPLPQKHASALLTLLDLKPQRFCCEDYVSAVYYDQARAHSSVEDRQAMRARLHSATPPVTPTITVFSQIKPTVLNLVKLLRLWKG